MVEANVEEVQQTAKVCFSLCERILHQLQAQGKIHNDCYWGTPERKKISPPVGVQDYHHVDRPLSIPVIESPFTTLRNDAKGNINGK